ncbi:MAG: YncE family protein [Acidobacteriaceae bacterium]
MKYILAAALMAASAVAPMALHAQDHLYKQSAKYVLGGEGGWDYLTYDPDTDRLFITRGDHVMVVQAADGKVVGDIPANGAHGVALVPEENKGFVTNGKAGTITAFDLKTLKPIGDVKVGEGPDAIIYDSGAKKVIVMNGHGKDVMAVDPAAMKVTNTIPGGGKLEFAQAGPGHVYVNVEDTNELIVIDSSSWKVTKRIALKPCDGPSGLAIDTKNDKLFPGCEKMIMVVDPKSGNVQMLPAGAGIDAMGYDPGLGYAVSSNGQDGNMTVVGDEGGTYKVLDTVPTEKGARTMAMDAKNHRIFLVTSEFEPKKEGERRPAMKPNTFTLLVYEATKK